MQFIRIWADVINLKSLTVFSHHFRSHSRLSYIHNIGTEPLQALTIGRLLEKSASQYGSKTAILSVYDNRRVSFEELLREANRLAAGFQNIGLKEGDKVGLWAPNIIENATTILALAQAGLITVGLNPINHQKEEVKFCINKVGLKALVCFDEYKKYQFYETLCQILPELETSEPGKLSSKTTPSLKSVITISQKELRGTYNYNDILDTSNEETLTNSIRKRNNQYIDCISTIQYTSGSTGRPKPTCTTHFQQVNNAYQIGKRLRLNPTENICLQMPLFHVFGTTAALLVAQHYGSAITLPSPLYNSSENLKAIEKEKCTVVYGTPTMFVDLISLQTKEKRNINPKSAVIGGSPCSPQLLKDMKQILKFQKINSLYGMTEVTATCFQSLPSDEDMDTVTNTVGYISDHFEAKVIDDNGDIVPIGVAGELCLRGYSIMLGYWDNEEKTKEVIGLDRWFRTGDQFVLQEDGYGRIVGRFKDIIIRGGENILPREIEDVLNTHPDILESQVIGLAHPRLGEEVCACIRLKPMAKFNYENVLAFCQDYLANYKIPSRFQVMDTFPRTVSGKNQKHLLKEEIERQT